MDNVYGAVIMTQVIARVHLVHLTNAGQRQTAADPQTMPTDLGCESACIGCRLQWTEYTTQALYYHSIVYTLQYYKLLGLSASQ